MHKSRAEPQKIDDLIVQIQRLERAEISMKAQVREYEEKIVLLAQEN